MCTGADLYGKLPVWLFERKCDQAIFPSVKIFYLQAFSFELLY